MDSSSDGMMWGDWGVGSELILDRWTEGMFVAVDIVDIGSI